MIIKLPLNINININVLAFAILLVASCFLLDSLYIDTEMLTTPMVSYEKIEEIAQTGDLVIFRWNTIDVGFRLFSKFSHVGMIVKQKGKLYILETHPKEIPESEIDDSGIHLYHLKNRLNEYDGTYYFTQLNTTNNKREKLRKHVKKRYHLIQISVIFLF